jgi:hypothetical protein
MALADSLDLDERQQRRRSRDIDGDPNEGGCHCEDKPQAVSRYRGKAFMAGEKHETADGNDCNYIVRVEEGRVKVQHFCKSAGPYNWEATCTKCSTQYGKRLPTNQSI